MPAQPDSMKTSLLSPFPQRRSRRRCLSPFAVLLAALVLAPACGSSPARSPESPAAPPETPKSAWPEPEQPEAVVYAELQTSARALPPKSTFLLAVRFDIAEGYRISWQNPGDVGKRTRVVFEVPEGFSAGPVRFPAPQRFELPGGLVNYGYERQTAVFAEVTTPERLPEGRPYRFEVRADWLACKDDCAREELSAWLELPSAVFAPAPELPAELVAHHAALPRPLSELPGSELGWTEGAAEPALTLRASNVKWIGFVPADDAQPKLLSVKPAGESLVLRFAGGAPHPLRGLAIAEVDGRTAFYDVDAPWPSR